MYDELNRLTEANSSSYGGNLVYQYDKAGNMINNCRYGEYKYEDPAHVHAVTSIEKNGEVLDTYAYDPNGNMESGANRTFSYDYDNRPTSIAYDGKATVNVYDASGFSVKKTIPDTAATFKTTTYIGDLYECTEGECVKYIFAGSNRVAKLDDTKTFYYHSDHLGSSSVVTDETSATAQELFYYPFGEIKTNTGSDVAKHKFTDQEWDGETGLYYYNARYYDPRLARFISADTIVPDPLNPQAFNRYSYVNNNPVLYTDPSGHCGECIVAIIIIIAAIAYDYYGDDENFNMNANVGMSSDSEGNMSTYNTQTGETYPTATGPPSSSYANYMNSGYSNSGSMQLSSSITLEFYNRYSDYDNNKSSSRDSINRDMHSKRQRDKKEKKARNISSGLKRMAKGFVGGLHLLGPVLVETGKMVGKSVFQSIVSGLMLDKLGKYKYLKFLQRNTTSRHAASLTVDKSVKIRESINNITGDYREMAERLEPKLKHIADQYKD